MKELFKITRDLWAAEWWSLTRGTFLTVVVLAFGTALLGLSGWFITAAGLAGAAGIGIAFDVFRPSAAVRFLALGRTAARYGERMLTHDAVLRSLAMLRKSLLTAITGMPFKQSAKLRVPEQISQLTQDVDALDGVALRLVIPTLAAITTVIGTTLVLWFLTNVWMPIIVLACLVPPTLLAFVYLFLKASAPARLAHQNRNQFRSSATDLFRSKGQMVMTGMLERYLGETLELDCQARFQSTSAEQMERNAGLIVSIAHLFALTAILSVGAIAVYANELGVAFLALAFFSVLALGETLLPLRRGFVETGKMVDAAKHIAPLLEHNESKASINKHVVAMHNYDDTALEFINVRFAHGDTDVPIINGFNATLKQGEIVTLRGASGSGKSTLLHLAAGLSVPNQGSIKLFGQAVNDLAETQLRNQLALVLQRSALTSGTVLQSLRLGNPTISDEEALHVLQAVQLADLIEQRNGLNTHLGEAGKGLSGGEARRLALARAIARRPKVLLLDEPTEGLDEATARKVLAGIRDCLPKATLLLASHREVEQQFVDRSIFLNG